MAVSANLSRTYQSGSTTINLTQTVTAESEVTVSMSVPDSSTNVELDGVSVDQSEMKYFVAKVDGAISVFTNAASTGSPDDSLVFAAAQQVVWVTGDILSNPITADITGSIFVTNASGSAVALELRFGADLQ